MKKYIKEIIILSLQLFMFYIFPMFAGPTDVIGMVVLIIASTALLSLIWHKQSCKECRRTQHNHTGRSNKNR